VSPDSVVLSLPVVVVVLAVEELVVDVLVVVVLVVDVLVVDALLAFLVEPVVKVLLVVDVLLLVSVTPVGSLLSGSPHAVTTAAKIARNTIGFCRTDNARHLLHIVDLPPSSRQAIKTLVQATLKPLFVRYRTTGLESPN